MRQRRQPLPADMAHRIYSALVETLHLRERRDAGLGMDIWRYTFVSYVTEGTWSEFRVGGELGMGGKVWNSGDAWFVNCYPEDMDPERALMIERANDRLAELWAEYYGSPMRRR